MEKYQFRLEHCSIIVSKMEGPEACIGPWGKEFQVV